MNHLVRALPVVFTFAMMGCGHAAPKEVGAPVGQPAELARPISFAFDSLDTRPVSSQGFSGKPTVMAFITTWDLLSQAQVDFLVAMARNDEKRTNYALVALQAAKERELVEQYARTLNVTFPIALVEPETRAHVPAFGEIERVPEVVVLDRDGRIAFRRTGLVKSDELRQVLSRLK